LPGMEECWPAGSDDVDASHRRKIKPLCSGDR
jgi:hypothetical protein